MHISILILSLFPAIHLGQQADLPHTLEFFEANNRIVTGHIESPMTLGSFELACPVATLYSHQPNSPSGFFNAGTSELSPQLRRSDYFHGVAGAITGIRWWGLDLRYLGGSTWAECTETDNTFDVVLYADAGGVPGTPVCTYTLVASRTPTGIIYQGAELNEYQVALPSPCVLVRGWLSVVGRGDPDCWFLWLSSTDDNDESYCNGCASPFQNNDLSFCLMGTVGGVFGACCNDTTSQCNDEKVEITSCTSANQRFLADATCDEFVPPCGTILGACCRPDATCDLTTHVDCPTSVGNWLGANTQCSSCPCIAPCPTNGQAEGEAVCSDGYVDTFNGGCNAAVHAVEPIPFDKTICGISGVYTTGTQTQGDWDYYEVHVTTAAQLTWTVTSEFPFQSWIVNGGNGCPPSVISTAQAQPCSPLSLSPIVQPGTYWLVVTPSAFTDSAACGARYKAIAHVPNSCTIGDVNVDSSINGVDISCFVRCITTVNPNCGDCRCADADQNGSVDTLDVDDFVNILLNAP